MLESVDITGIDEHFNVHFIENTSIVSVKRESNASPNFLVDIWSEWLVNLLKRWPANQQVLMVHDLRSSSVTRYSQTKLRETLLALPQNLTGRYAAVTNNSPVGRLIRIIVNNVVTRLLRGRGIQVRIFMDYDEAVNWLKSDVN